MSLQGGPRKGVARYDLIVIGSGPAGHKAAIQGAKAGKSVLLIERARRVGGECVRHGTIPSKTLRETAVRLASTRERLQDLSSIELSEDVQIASLMTELQSVIRAHETYLGRQIERNGIDRLHGRATFVSPWEIEVEDVRGEKTPYAADYFVIAVGSKPRTPDNVPIDHENVFDSDSWLSINYLPTSLIVLGGGVIASEYASTFARLGVAVTMVDRAPRPLAFLDPELSERFKQFFESQDGCRYVGEADIQSVHWDGVSKVQVTLADGQVLEADKLLCALGRVANLRGLGIENTGVEITARGQIAVDENCRTNVEHIYAAGDVIGPPALASASMDQGRRAVRHAFGLPLGSPSEMIPAGIFTIPEISTVGLTEEQAIERHGGAMCGEAHFKELARAHIDGSTDGYMRLIADGEGRKILGAQIYGEGATELVHVVQMAMIAGFEVDVFIETIMNFPTLSEAYRVAALDIAKQRDVKNWKPATAGAADQGGSDPGPQD